MHLRLERLLQHEATAWVVLGVSVVMTLLAWDVSSQYLGQEARQRFDKSVQRAKLDIQKRMEGYQEVLRASAGLYNSSDFVTRQEWHVFVKDLKLDMTYPGIQGLGYAEMVPARDKLKFEARIRAEGFPDFDIKPEGVRDPYSAIIYLEPFDRRNRRAFGYDMYSERTRRIAMQRACDTGDIALSGHVTLMQETETDIQKGFLLYIPIFRQGMPVGTVAERRAALTGFVYGVFRAGDLMRGILGEGMKWLNFALYDDGEASSANLIFHADAVAEVENQKTPGTVAIRKGNLIHTPQFTDDVHFNIGGHEWTARFSSSPQFESEVSSILPGLIAAGGVLADILLFVALHTMSRSRKRLARSNAQLAASREALAEERSRYEKLVENLPGVVYRCAVAKPWPVHFVSHRIDQLSSIPAEDFMSGQYSFGNVVHPEDLPDVTRAIDSAVAAGWPYEIEFRFGQQATGWRWLISRGQAQYDHAGQPLWLDGVAFDITERKKQEQEAVERELRYRAVIETTTDGFWLLDKYGNLTNANAAYCRMSGFTLEELLKFNIRDLEAEEESYETMAHIHKVLAWGNDRFETRHRRKDGSVWPAEVTVSIIPSLEEMFVFIRDLTEIKAFEAERVRSEEQMRRLAFHDPLTKLPNRRLLSDRLKQALAACQRSGEYGALLFLDMDNFKHLNDSLGHEMGDLLLIEVAQRLKSCVREADTVARLGGDEFVVMLPELSTSLEDSALDVRSVGEKILATLNRPYQLEIHTYQSTPSIGATLFSGEEGDVDTILRRADTAMYQVKASGRNALRFFDTSMEHLISEQSLLDACLRGETDGNTLELHYQPLFDRSNRVVGAEALVRWRHPERGLLRPAQFLNLAEESGLIVLLGRRVLEQACAQLAKWSGKPKMAELDLTVNISARHFRQPGFVDDVQGILAKSGANPNRLIFELGEMLLRENNLPSEVMETLKAKGIRFSLDNFGACYLSLGAILNKLPVDQLKLAINGLSGHESDSAHTALLDALVVLGNQMDTTVVAKGVETQAQWDLLQVHGWQHVQGYLFGSPVPAEELERLCCSR